MFDLGTIKGGFLTARSSLARENVGAGSARRTRRQPESGASAYWPTIRRTEAAPTFFDFSFRDGASLVKQNRKPSPESYVFR